MPRPRGTTDRQNRFLRELIQHPQGLPAELWPSPVVLRRWLRKPRFRAALASLRQGLYFRSDLQLAYASAAASARLQHLATAPEPQSSTDQDGQKDHPRPEKLLTDLLKLAHTRQRFAPQEPTRPPVEPAQSLGTFEEYMDTVHPDTPVGQARDFYRRRIQELKDHQAAQELSAA